MPEDKPPPKPVARTENTLGGLGGITEGLRMGMGPKNAEALAQMAARLQLPIFRESYESPRLRGPTTASQPPALQPAVAGGDDDKKPPSRRTKRGKVTTRGRHRVMNHWEIFDSELNELAGLQRDTLRSFGIGAFFAGVSIDVLRDVFTSDMPSAPHAFWFAIGICAGILAVWNFLNGRHYRHRGKTRLQQIKDEHDEE